MWFFRLSDSSRWYSPWASQLESTCSHIQISTGRIQVLFLLNQSRNTVTLNVDQISQRLRNGLFVHEVQVEADGAAAIDSNPTNVRLKGCHWSNLIHWINYFSTLSLPSAPFCSYVGLPITNSSVGDVWETPAATRLYFKATQARNAFPHNGIWVISINILVFVTQKISKIWNEVEYKYHMNEIKYLFNIRRTDNITNKPYIYNLLHKDSRLFHEDFSVNQRGVATREIFMKQSVGKSKKINF